MKLKKLIAILLAGALTVSMVACGTDNGSKDSDAGNETKSAEETDENVEANSGETRKVSMLTQASMRNDGINAVFDYVEEKLNVKFEFEEVPDGDSGDQLISAKISTGEVPDILMWQHASYINSRTDVTKFENLSDMENLKYYDTDALTTRQYTIDGNMIVAPFGTADIFGICYNKAIFEEYGLTIPNSWSELVDICEVLKEADVIPMYLSGKDAWTLQIPFLDSLAKEYYADSELIEKMDVKEIMWKDLSIAKDSLTNLHGLVANGYVQDTYLSDTFVDAQNALLEGETAMYPMGSSIVPQLMKVTGDEEKLANLGIFAIPQNDENAVAAVSYPGGLSVPGDGGNVELAKEIINEMCSPEAMEIYLSKQGGIPFVQGVETENIGIIADAQEIISSGKTGMAVEALTKYTKGALETYIQDMLIDNRDEDGVLSELDNDFSKQAKDANDPNWE